MGVPSVNTFITQYGRRKPKMPQKRNRVRKAGIMIVPKEPLSEKERKWLEDLKKGKKLGEGEIGKPVKPKKPKPPKRGDKKFKIENPIYRGEPLDSGRRSI
jgi:hypothetical protein